MMPLQYAVIPTENARPSCIAYDDNRLLISSETLHADFESMVHYTDSFQKSETNGYATIPMKQMTSIQYHTSFPECFVQYRKDGTPKLRKRYFSIASDELRRDFCVGLAEQSGLRTKKEFQNQFAQLADNLVFIALTVLFTYVAQYIANGGLSYSRKALVQLVVQVLEMTGPSVPIFIGSLFFCYYLYRIIRNFIRPTTTVVFN